MVRKQWGKKKVLGRKRFAVKHSSEKVLSKLIKSAQIGFLFELSNWGKMTRFQYTLHGWGNAGMPSGRVGWHECCGAFKAVAAEVSEPTLLPQWVSRKGILAGHLLQSP